MDNIMTFYDISRKLDANYKTWSSDRKAWTVILFVLLVLLFLSAFALGLYTRYTKNLEIENYKAVLEKSKQNYYLQSIANSNLEKKLQEMLLELAKMKNNTVELERIFQALYDEKASLEEIRQQMETGLKNTKFQLDKMQHSVNSLIDQRTKTIISTERDIIYEKSDTHGK
jgi:parvulin-like peptidyl-prolyl isomerase